MELHGRSMERNEARLTSRLKRPVCRNTPKCSTSDSFARAYGPGPGAAGEPSTPLVGGEERGLNATCYQVIKRMRTRDYV